MQQQVITNKKIEMLLEELKEVKIRLDRFFDYIPPKNSPNHKSIDEFEDDYFSVRPSVRRRWERISKEMDQGKGRKFKSMVEFRKFMREL